jgi:transcriptional regulator with XRE-family HTH domain
VPTVRQWTGHEAALLRRALRLSVRAFAARLGVAQRTVSKWEALGRSTEPRPDTQAILDTALAQADTATQTRFELLLQSSTDVVAFAGPRAWDYETWSDDLDRTVVNLSRQNFVVADRLLHRWLRKFALHDLDSKGQYLYARSLVLLADLKRDQGMLNGDQSARQTYHQARDIFGSLDIPRRMAQIELSLAVVTEMSGGLETAAEHYQSLSSDVRLSERDRARAQLWIGTALSKDGQHLTAATMMQPVLRKLEALDEPDDWSVAHQKIALAYRGAGKLDHALNHIAIAVQHGVTNTPMQRVRLNTAHAHILLSDRDTETDGLSLLDEAAALSTQFGLAHQLTSINAIRSGFERTAG